MIHYEKVLQFNFFFTLSLEIRYTIQGRIKCCGRLSAASVWRTTTLMVICRDIIFYLKYFVAPQTLYLKKIRHMGIRI